MLSILDQLNTEYEDLGAFTSSIAPVNKALATHHDVTVRKYLTLRRQYDYAAFVVAIYASFERYVETLVAEYARIISEFTLYACLPEPLIKKHLSQSADMFKKRLGEGRYAHLSPEIIAKNLFNCLSGNNNYTLTSDAIIAHDTNFRYQDVSKLFGEVGIEGVANRLPGTDAVQKWLIANYGDAAPKNNSALIGILDGRLGDLIERRNEVAHRGGSADELLGQDQMVELLGFMGSISGGLFELTVGAYFKKKLAVEGYSESLVKIEGPYKDNTVMVFSPPAGNISIGQRIISTSANGMVRWGSIIGIQLDGVSVDGFITGQEVVSVGLEFDFSCKGNSQFYMLTKSDEIVWAM